MPEQIRDGRGRGNLATVNSDGQIITRATAIPQHTKSSVDGNYYEAYTGKVTLVDAVERGIIYLDNQDPTDYIIVDKVFIDVWASTGGVGGGTITYYKNPDITGGTAIVPVNTNFSKSEGLEGTQLRTLTTMLGGTQWWEGYFEPSSSIVINEEKFCIPPGYDFGISITPPAGNTSMDINVNIAFYLLDIDLLA